MRRGRRWVTVVAVMALLPVMGCSGSAGLPPEEVTRRTGTALPQDEGGPLLGLPPCSTSPRAQDSEVPGLLLPDGAVVTSVQRQDPLTTVEAYVEITPIEVRRFYQRRPGLEIFEIEDEIFEAETLFADGEGHRSYVKARAACRTGSTLLVVVAPEVAGGGLPSPSGG